MQSDEIARAAAFWDKNKTTSDFCLFYFKQPSVKACYQSWLFGDSTRTIYHYITDIYVRGERKGSAFKRGLSLGTGTGIAEGILLRAGAVEHFDCYDISPSSCDFFLSSLREEGLEAKVNYTIADLNTVKFPRDDYDFILSSGALHHVGELDHLIENLAKCCIVEGLLLAAEYVGPQYQMYSEDQLLNVNRLLSLLPPEVRASSGVVNPPLHTLLEIDPTEAITSEQIMPALERQFDIISEFPYGGTILAPLFTRGGLSEDFLRIEARDERWHYKEAIIALLAEIERSLIAAGAISSDYRYIIARKRK